MHQGSWGGKGTSKKAFKDKQQKFKKHIPGVAPEERLDAGMTNVIISTKQGQAKAAKQYMVKDLPYPFTSRQQYEDSLKTAMGREWNSERSMQRLTKPRILVRKGEAIAPIRKFR